MGNISLPHTMTYLHNGHVRANLISQRQPHDKSKNAGNRKDSTLASK